MFDQDHYMIMFHLLEDMQKKGEDEDEGRGGATGSSSKGEVKSEMRRYQRKEKIRGQVEKAEMNADGKNERK